jgi:hypothetical protein
MDYHKLSLIVLAILFIGSGILGMALGSAMLVYLMIFFGFAFLAVFWIWWLKWQKQKITESFAKNKAYGYIYVIVLFGLIIAGIIYKIYFK